MESESREGSSTSEEETEVVSAQLQEPTDHSATTAAENNTDPEEQQPEDSDPDDDDDDDETPGVMKRLTIDETVPPPSPVVKNRIMITRTLAEGERFDDKYIYCMECGVEHHGDCPVNGPLMRMRDSPVSSEDLLKADHSLPIGLTVIRSSIPGAGLGVWTGIELRNRTVFGPYVGRKVDVEDAVGSDYCWQILGPEKPSHCIDGKDLAASNWMRYCNSSDGEQNLQAFQYRGHIFYRTTKQIEKGSELFVGYGWKIEKSEGGVSCLPLAGKPNGTESLESVGEDGDAWTSDDAAELSMPHKCHVCNVAFELVDQLTHHQTTKHNFRFIYRCLGCPRSFCAPKQLTTHQNRTQHSGVQRVVLQLPVDERSSTTAETANVGAVEDVPTAETSFRCEQCPLVFTSKVLQAEHAIAEHRVKKEAGQEAPASFPCTLCPQRFTHRKLLEEHRREAHLADPELHCQACDSFFADEYELAQHQTDVHRVAPSRNRKLVRLERSDAGSSSAERNPGRNMAVGWKPGAPDKPKQVTGLEAVSCPHCPMRFTHASVLRNHISTKHPSQRAGPPAVAARDPKRHRVPPMTVIKCKLCNASFLSEGVLRMHIASKHAGATIPASARPKTIHCPHCPQRFDSITLIERHIQTLHGDPGADKASGLPEGGTVEPGARSQPRGVHLIAKKIRKRLTLDRKIRRQQCHVCQATFTQIRSLRKHLRRQHGIRWMYTCLECKQGFDVYQKLLTHQQSLGHRGLDKPLGGPEDVRATGQQVASNDLGRPRSEDSNVEDSNDERGSPRSPSSSMEAAARDGAVVVKREPSDEPNDLGITADDSAAKLHNTRNIRGSSQASPTKSGADLQVTSPVNGERRCVCHVCGWTTKRPSHLYEHQFSKHGVTVNYKCLDCQSSFDFYRGLQVHQKETRHRGTDRVFVGPDDAAKLPTKREEEGEEGDPILEDEPEVASDGDAGGDLILNVPKPLPRADRPRSHRCNVCGSTFQFFTELRLHRQRTHNVRMSYTCAVCRQQFWSFQELRAHKELRHSQARRKLTAANNEDVNVPAGDPNNAGQRGVKRPLPWKRDDRPAKRPLGELLRLFGNVKQHPKKFSCDKCNSSFTRNYNLTHHQQRMHGGGGGDVSVPAVKEAPPPDFKMPSVGQQRPFPCPSCDASFSRSDRLKLHLVRLHGADKRQPTSTVEGQQRPFPCQACGASFSRVDRLRRHQVNIHGSEAATGRPFSSPSRLESVRPFTCHVCDFSFSRLDRLRRHQIKQHGIDVKQLPALKEDQLRPFVCRLCDTSFSRHDSLRHHQLRKHNSAIKRSVSSTEESPPRLQIIVKKPPSSPIKLQSPVKPQSPVKSQSPVKQQSPVKPPIVKAELLKPFSCHLCESSFTRHDNLRQHQLRLHGFDAKRSPISEEQRSGETGSRVTTPKVELPRPFSCHSCDASFSRLDRLKSHRVKMHGIDVEQPPVVAKEGQLKPFACDVCGSSFTRHNNLKHHQFEKHGIIVK